MKSSGTEGAKRPAAGTNDTPPPYKSPASSAPVKKVSAPARLATSPTRTAAAYTRHSDGSSEGFEEDPADSLEHTDQYIPSIR